MSYGFMGKIARINLTTGRISVEIPKEEFYMQYLGGQNIAAYYMLKEIPPGANPLGAENILVAATSVLTGTKMAGSSRYTLAAKSPLTGAFGSSEAGGFWGPELKSAGFDALIVEGRSEKPVYIYINNGEIKIKDALHLWGKDTKIVQEAIRDENGDKKIRVLQTGIAGENLVRFAAVTNELKHWHGRSGMGAVMGSKNLRAIAVRGSQPVKVYDSEKFNAYIKWFGEARKKHEGLVYKSKMGTSSAVEILNQIGLLPTHNFVKGEFAFADSIGSEELLKYTIKRDSCYACPITCKRVVEAKSKKYSIDPEYGGPEYETLGLIGSSCEIKDMEAILKANELCAKYGLDTISTGGVIAFAMECMEKGIITDTDTGGISFNFGDGDSVLQVIEMIAMRRGFGDVLAEGSLRAARKIGKGAEQYSMNVKGQELPAHDPRGKWGVGLGYAISPKGAEHLVFAHDFAFENPPVEDGDALTGMDILPLRRYGIRQTFALTSLEPQKIRMLVKLQILWTLYDVLDLCIFIGVPEMRITSIDQIREVVNAVCGWDLSHSELFDICEKGIHMGRIFNNKHGFTKDDDKLPDRMFEPIENGVREGYKMDRDELTKAIDTYYEMMGWTLDGGPTFGKLASLQLEEFYA